MTWLDALILLGGGALAGVINAMAGGGSLLTVPLLSLVGVEGLSANAPTWSRSCSRRSRRVS